jgi:membrane protease subunit (stomatin/prohibitin family)
MLSRQLRSVIEWKDPAADVLFERWSEHGDEIKNASKLIVGPGQGCLFVYEGQILEAYTTPGMVDLRTGNVPFVTTLTRLMQGFASEHKVNLTFFKTTKLLNLKWGTPSPIKYEDPRYKLPVGLRAFGNYSVRISDAPSFFRDVVGGKARFTIEDLREPLNARLTQPLADFLAESRFSYADIDPNREEIAAGLAAKLGADFARLGFALDDFRIQGTSFDEDTMRRINRIADVSAEAQAASSAGVSYAELQQLAALRDAARNPGAAGAGMAMAVGMNLAGAAQPAADDAAAKLQRLKALLADGLITQAEHDAKKREILARL